MRALIIVFLFVIASGFSGSQYSPDGDEEPAPFDIVWHIHNLEWSHQIQDYGAKPMTGGEGERKKPDIQAGPSEEKAGDILVVAVGHIKRGDYKRALHIIEEALKTFEEKNHKKLRGDALFLTGIIYEKQGNDAKGADYLIRSSDIYRGTGHPVRLGYSLKKLGDVYVRLNDHAQALDHYREGIEAMNQAGHPAYMALLHQHVGQTYHALGLHSRALEHLYRSVELSQISGDPHQLTASQGRIGALYLAQGARDSAAVYLLAALDMAKDTGNLYHQKNVAESLVDLYEGKGEADQALRYHRLLKSAADSLERKSRQARIKQINNDHAFELERLHLQDQLMRQQFRQNLSMTGLGVSLLIILILTRYYREKKKGMQALQKKNEEILRTQDQLILQEKMASLGQLAAGIAHEIKNPLNFINNFAEGSVELTEDLREELEKQNIALEKGNFSATRTIIEDLKQNSLDINRNGRRADRIVHSIMEHARGNKAETQQVDLHALIDENVNLAFHSFRALNPAFHLLIEKEYDPMIGSVEAFPQDLGRVVLNIISNACYALNEKRKTASGNYLPTLAIQTRSLEEQLEITLRDNGPGIPEEIRQAIFTPFFTTKPTGVGHTGLGLAISHDIIKEHRGALLVDSAPGEFTEFTIRLPKGGAGSV